MPTVHNRANVRDIAKTVIMPGDPLRAKYIAENFLENVKLVSRVRNVLAYTGTYNGKHNGYDRKELQTKFFNMILDLNNNFDDEWVKLNKFDLYKLK